MGLINRENILKFPPANGVNGNMIATHKENGNPSQTETAQEIYSFDKMKNTFDIGNPFAIKFHKITNATVAEKLFAGFDEFYFVSFATSLRALLKLFNTHQFKKVQGIIGDSMTDNFKDELKDDQEQVLAIMDKIKSKEWLIYIRKEKKAVIHDKFYLLKNENNIRIIIGSANLTETGLYGKGQKNIMLAIDYDLPGTQDNKKAIKCFFDYFNDTQTDCELFMQNLITLFEKEGDDPTKHNKIISRWLNECNEELINRDVKKFHNEIKEAVLDHASEQHTNFTIKLPDNKDAQKIIEKLYPPAMFERTTDKQIIIPGRRYFKMIKDIIQYPLMYIKNEGDKRVVYLFTDELRSRTTSLYTPQEVNLSLQNLEDFCNTVDLGQTENPTRAKMIFYEAMLYFLNAPFSHELMKVKKETVGIADDTGLQYLFICGLGANSKTQLVRFMLKVLTGQLINPLPVDQFTTRKVQHISNYGTIFPIVVDDVKNEKLGGREDLLKNYWEKQWSPENDCPQLIVTTNYRNILNKEWASRRIKGLDFEVVFKKKHENSQKLNQIMSDSNSIFNYFSYYYLNKIDIKKMFRIEDELIVARLVMKELYKFANREIPEYFPERPVEEKYNKNLEKWQKSIKLRKIDIKYTNGSVCAFFPLDMKNEMRSHLKALPQELVSEMHGDMIISNRVAEFKHWLRSVNTKKGLWERLCRSLGVGRK